MTQSDILSYDSNACEIPQIRRGEIYSTFKNHLQSYENPILPRPLPIGVVRVFEGLLHYAFPWKSTVEFY